MNGVNLQKLSARWKVNGDELVTALQARVFVFAANSMEPSKPSKGTREELSKIAQAANKLIRLVEGASEAAIILLARDMVEDGQEVIADLSRDIIVEEVSAIARCASNEARSLRLSRKRYTGAVSLAERTAVRDLSVVWFKSHQTWPSVTPRRLPGEFHARGVNDAGQFVIEAARAVGLTLNLQRLRTIIASFKDWPPATLP